MNINLLRFFSIFSAGLFLGGVVSPQAQALHTDWGGAGVIGANGLSGGNGGGITTPGGVGGGAVTNQPGDAPATGEGGAGAAGSFGGTGGNGGAAGAADVPNLASGNLVGTNGDNGVLGGGGGGGGAGLIFDSATTTSQPAGGKVIINIPGTSTGLPSSGRIEGGRGGIGSCANGTNCGGGGGGGAGAVIHNDGNFTLEITAGTIDGGQGGAGDDNSDGAGGGGAGAVIFGTSPVIFNFAAQTSSIAPGFIYGGNGGYSGGNSGDGLILTNGNDVTVIGKPTAPLASKGIGVGYVQATTADLAAGKGKLGTATFFSGDNSKLMLQGGMNIYGGTWNANTQMTGLAVDFQGSGNRLTLTTNTTPSFIGWTTNVTAAHLTDGVLLVSMAGDNNSIELQPNTSIDGILSATGADNGIAFGGTLADSVSHPTTFDLSRLASGTFTPGQNVPGVHYYGIDRLEKIGTSWWTLDNTQESDAPWTIVEGHLVMGANGDLSNSSHISLGTPDTPPLSFAVLNLGQLGAGTEFKIKALSGSSAGLIDDCETVASGDESCDAGDPHRNVKLVITDASDDEYAGKIQTTGGVEIADGTQIFTGNLDNLGNVAITGTGVLQLGNGGTTGTLADLPIQIDPGAKLVFNRSGPVEFNSTFSGAGTIEIRGGLELTLSGDSSSFTGQTLVSKSLLWVDDGGVLGGTVSAVSDSFLGGKGTIVGNATISDGATLYGKQGYTLNFANDLTLSNNSVLDVMLNQPATQALFNVGHNLALEGTLNIRDMGAFGPGLYRLFNYGGTLNILTLNIGTLPSGSDPLLIAVQSDTTNKQINLYYAGAVVGSFNSWDGDVPANHGNHNIDGGNGTWDTNNDNWTTVDGASNGPWDNGNYALFGGSPGTVRVDNNGGQITTQGLVFLVDGYRLEDQSIILSDPNNQHPTISVGNNTLAGAAMTATVATELTGSQGLRKTDLGTLILIGSNSYTGGTTVSQGALQLGNDTTAGSILGDVIVESDSWDDATLAFGYSGETDFTGKISGDGKVLQNGSGVTVFKGDSSFTGGLTVAKGTAKAGILDNAFGTGLLTVQAGGIADLNGFNTTVGGLDGAGSVILGDAALTLNQDIDKTFSGAISGNGDLIKNGSGILTLTGANSYTGTTVVNGGTLLQGQGGAFSPNAAYLVGGNAELGLGGSDTTLAALTNSGTVRFGGTGGTTLTVNGNYTGNGSTLLMNIVLQDDSSKTDMLKVEGDTAGSTILRFINRGGSGDQTVEGIKVVDIAGQSTGTFTLGESYKSSDGAQAIVAGAYAYTLHQGSVSMPDDGDWYLRSELKDGSDTGPRYSPAIPIYESMMQAMQALNSLPTLQQRTGNQYWTDTHGTAVDETRKSAKNKSGRAAGDQYTASERAVWGRIEGAHNHFEPATSATGTSVNVNLFQLQAGVDGQFYENRGKLIGSITGQYGTSHSNISSIYGDGSIQMQGWSLGTALTWYGDSGCYADGQAQATWYDSDLHSDTANTNIADGRKGFGYALSLETGKRFGVNDHWSLTPQIQLMWSSVSFNSFNDIWGADVSLHDGDNLRGRLGVSADYSNAWYGADGTLNLAKIYGIVNLYQDFLGDMRFKVADVAFDTANSRTWGGIGGGGTYSWASERYAIYGEGSLNSPLNRLGDSYTVKGSVGFKVRW